jgi:hypothetical protein
MYDAFTEIYEIVRSIQVVGKDRETYKIDILWDLREDTVYQARFSVMESYTIQPTYPQSYGEYEKKPRAVNVWIRLFNMASVSADTPEKALEQALFFLSERAKGGTNSNGQSGESVQ